MTTILLEDAGPVLADLAKRVEGGETIVVTRRGKPVLDLVPHRSGDPLPPETERHSGLNWEAAYAYLRAHDLSDPFPFVADDFDDPVPEAVLLRPLP